MEAGVAESKSGKPCCCTNPECVLVILTDACHAKRTVPIAPELPSVIPTYSSPGPEPHVAPRILKEVGDCRLRKSICCCVGFEWIYLRESRGAHHNSSKENYDEKTSEHARDVGSLSLNQSTCGMRDSQQLNVQQSSLPKLAWRQTLSAMFEVIAFHSSLWYLASVFSNFFCIEPCV